MAKMKFTKKKLLAVIVFLNIYVITFFCWFVNTSPHYIDLKFVENDGVVPVTVYAPIVFVAGFPLYNGIQTAVSCVYAPLCWFMEKRGLGYYYYSEASLYRAWGVDGYQDGVIE